MVIGIIIITLVMVCIILTIRYLINLYDFFIDITYDNEGNKVLMLWYNYFTVNGYIRTYKKFIIKRAK